jgi:hypothetical protein
MPADVLRAGTARSGFALQTASLSFPYVSHAGDVLRAGTARAPMRCPCLAKDGALPTKH